MQTSLLKRCVAISGAIVLFAAIASWSPTSTVSAAGTGYVSLQSPARILDTRPEGATVDGQFAAAGIRPLGGTLTLATAGRAGIPSDAAAVVLNVTVTEAQAPGFITVFPCDVGRPHASNLNYVAGRSIPNLVIAKIAADGTVCLFNTAATHLIVDVAGYFPGTDALTPLTSPARLLDTRADGITIDGVSMGQGIRPAGNVQVLQVTGRAGVPTGVVSVVLNVTVDQPQAIGFITVFPCDAPIPTASNVNYVTAQTIPNAVVARLSAAGTVCLYTSASTHEIVDIAGYFANSTVVVPLAAPARLLDTRADGATIDGQFKATGLRPTGGTIQLTIAGRAGIPSTASAVVLNITVDQPQAQGFITAYPTGVGRPNASNLNYITGQTVPNAVIARLGSGGTLCLFNSGATHLIVDIAGYITGPPPEGAGLACPADPPPPATTSTTTTPTVTTQPGPTTTAPGLDPRYPTCTAAKAAGYGPYYINIDPEYYWYDDRDNDGIVCE